MFLQKKKECCLGFYEKKNGRTPSTRTHAIHTKNRSISRTHARIMSKSCAGMLEEMLKCAEQSKCYLSRSRSRSRRENSNSEEGGGNDDDDALEFCVNALMRTTTTNDDDDDDDDEKKKKKKNNNKNQITELGLDECVVKKQVYLKCKRGQMDMRTRLRGNKGY